MVEALISIRPARLIDSRAIAVVHDKAWRNSYRGIIPGKELERMISLRGPQWWARAIRHGSRLLVLDFDDCIGGYVSYGRNRLPNLPYSGEIFELYLSAEYQGLGFGRRLFKIAQRDLCYHGLRSFVVWVLADNDRAMGFYEHMGGSLAIEGDEWFGKKSCRRLAYSFS